MGVPSPRIRRLEREADHSPYLVAKERVELYLHSYMLSQRTHGQLCLSDHFIIDGSFNDALSSKYAAPNGGMITELECSYDLFLHDRVTWAMRCVPDKTHNERTHSI